MGAQSRGHLYHVPSQKLLKSRTTLTASIWQIKRGSCIQLEKLLTFTDQDSDNDNSDCEADVKYCPDSEAESAEEENDMEDDSFVLPLLKL